MELEYKFSLPIDAKETEDFYTKAAAWSFCGICLAGPAKRMHTAYFDTPDRSLDHHRAVLRLRSEDDQTVMTFKLPPPDDVSLKTENDRLQKPKHLHRSLEFNVNLKHFYTSPPTDLFAQFYEDWPAGVSQQLQAALPLATESYGEVLFVRQQHLIQTGTTAIEVAIDRGIFKNQGRELPFAEVEFELKQGDATVLDRLAAEVSRRYDLKPGLYSKYQQCKAL